MILRYHVRCECQDFCIEKEPKGLVVARQRITAEQLRAARALLKLGQQELSEMTGVSVPTIKRLEGGAGPLRATYETVASIVEALDSLGIEWIDGNGHEPTVALKKAPNDAAGPLKAASRRRQQEDDDFGARAFAPA
jgi:transcriptional regulator with XRE-family HTH domain